MAGAARALPDVKGRLTMDTSQATKAEAAVRASTSQMKTHLGGLSLVSKDTEKKIGDLSGRLGGLGPIGEKAGSAINALQGALTSTLGPVTMAAGALLGLGGLVFSGTEKYLGLAKAVKGYMARTGESADVASRQIQAFSELGVGADVAGAAMFKLSKAIETTPKKLEALGIEVARDTKGGVDLNETFLNLIDTWNATGDTAKRNQILFTAFGKAGATMIPVFQEGTKRLRELEAAVRVVMTDKDIEQAHKYELAVKQNKASWDAFWENLGRHVVPVMYEVSNSFNRQEYVMKRLKELGYDNIKANQMWADSNHLLASSNNQVVEGLKKQWDADQKAQSALDELTAAHKRAADAAKEQEQALVDLDAEQRLNADASLRLAHDQLALEKSAKNVDAAQDALTKSIKQYGPASEEAAAASLALREAQLADVDAVVRLAQDQETLAEKLAKAGGAVMSATEKHDGYLSILQKLEATLAPDSLLRSQLDAYIQELLSVPANISTMLSLDSVATRLAAGLSRTSRARAGGGEVGAGQSYTVGEEGPETLVMGPASLGYIIPNPGRAAGWAQQRLASLGSLHQDLMPPGPAGPQARRRAAGGFVGLAGARDVGAGNTGGIETLLAQTNRRLEDLIAVVTAEPTGQTGVAAALYKAVNLAGQNRLRGMSGA